MHGCLDLEHLRLLLEEEEDAIILQFSRRTEDGAHQCARRQLFPPKNNWFEKNSDVKEFDLYYSSLSFLAGSIFGSFKREGCKNKWMGIECNT